MSENVFEVVDKSGRKIRLTKKQWSHTLRKHPSLSDYLEEIKETLQNPIAITYSDADKDVRFYYRYYKHLPSPHKYLLVIVKYLNGEGFIISTYFEKTIK